MLAVLFDAVAAPLEKSLNPPLTTARIVPEIRCVSVGYDHV